MHVIGTSASEQAKLNAIAHLSEKSYLQNRIYEKEKKIGTKFT